MTGMSYADGRKRHVHVTQDEILAAVLDVSADGGVAPLDDVAEHFDIHPITARHKLDGLVAQGKLRLIQRRPAIYDAPEPTP